MFKIGEFSKFSHVPTSALRYYDEIGLLKPQCIDEHTGYRFYSAQQFAQLSKIIALKDLGMSLEQIQKVLTESLSYEELNGMLILHKLETQKSLAMEEAKLKRLEARIEQIEIFNNTEFNGIELKSLAPSYFLSYRETLPHIKEAPNLAAQVLQAQGKYPNSKTTHKLAKIMHDDAYKEDQVDIEYGLISKEKTDLSICIDSHKHFSYKELPYQELALCMVHVGLPCTTFKTRVNIACWMEENHYQLCAPAREIFIVPPQEGKFDQTVVELQYPIEKIESKNL